jgi:hypothetical protein
VAWAPAYALGRVRLGRGLVCAQVSVGVVNGGLAEGGRGRNGLDLLWGLLGAPIGCIT